MALDVSFSRRQTLAPVQKQFKCGRPQIQALEVFVKLYFAPASPYSRKVRAAAVELGLAEKIELLLQLPRDNAKGFFSVNPLARIPVLETDDGIVLFDSPVICDYLDSLSSAPLCPRSGPQRFSALKRQAIGDGLLDNLVPLRGELLRPKEQQSPDFINRAYATVDRTLRVLDGDAGGGDRPNIGDIAIGCALAYLDFRFADHPWRDANPQLAAWFQTLSARPCFSETPPV
jgi:glutathione S-transferase